MKKTNGFKGVGRWGLHFVPLALMLVMVLAGVAYAELEFIAGSTDVDGSIGKNGKSWRIGYINTTCMEGATKDAYETCVYATDPTADNNILWPNASGTVQLTSGYGLVLTGTDGQILVYNALSNSFNAKTLSGATINNSGVFTPGDETITTGKIVNGQDGSLLISTDASSGSVAWVTPSGDVTFTNAGVGTIGADKVTASKLFINSTTVLVAAGATYNTTTVASGSVMTGYAPLLNVNGTAFANTVQISGTLAIVCTTTAPAYDQSYTVFYVEP